ncbi:MAG: glycosyltransferase family 4 protein [Candidatus Velthaea sp.]
MIRLAVDALNLRADERGMGRYVRGVLRTFAARDDIALTLLVRDPDNAARYRAIAGDRAAVAATNTARRRGRYDAVWYPWNAMRFSVNARSLATVNDDFAFAYPARGLVARLREQRPIVRAVRRATRVATISEWSRGRLAARFRIDPGRIAVLPLQPAAFFCPAAERAPFREPFVLAVGGPERRKNMAFFADAFARAFPARDVRLAIAGELEPPARHTLQRTGVRFTQFPACGDELLRRLYRTAAVVAVPSLDEGFGLVAVEAQACGAPVVASNTSALPEAVDGAGALVAPDDRSGWISALRRIVHDRELNGRLRAQGAARWSGTARDATASALLALLHRLVDERA